MGSPSIITWIEDDEYWIYYSEQIKHVLFMKPSIIDRNIIVLKFNPEDRVDYYKKFDLTDADNKFFININKTFVDGHKSNFFYDFFNLDIFYILKFVFYFLQYFFRVRQQRLIADK